MIDHGSYHAATDRQQIDDNKLMFRSIHDQISDTACIFIAAKILHSVAARK